MKKSDAVFLTTIFPASKKYLDDFFTSLQRQTYRNFDILVINDRVDNFNSYITQYPDLSIIEIISELTPAKNRETGINKALELDYKFIVFGDSDDYFSENRMQKSLEVLKNNDIVINELTLFSHNNRNNNFLTTHLKDINSLQEKNFNSNIFGFSNIAVRSEIIESPIDFEDNLIAVDWFFITTLLLRKPRQVQFLKEVQTYYRQYDNNHFEKYSLIFSNKLKQVQKLREELSNPSFKKKYIDIVNSNITEIFSGWWSEIITLEEFYMYENSNQKR
ncbi:hypothetical protein ES705_12108 [subsurface metagenome]